MEVALSANRKSYRSLDMAKFICALLIISAHFASEWASFPVMIDYAFSLYVVAVPFFFACSGFLFFKKLLSLKTEAEQLTYFISYEKRLWIMYGLWSLVYFPFCVFSWIQKGVFGFETILKYLHMALVSQTYATIWFLPALAIGIAIVFFLYRKVNKTTLAIISAVLYIVGMFGYTYSFAVEGTLIGDLYDWYLVVFKTVRNGLFNGVPFVFIGLICATKELKPSRKRFWKFSMAALLSLVAMAAECFMLKYLWDVTGMDICVFVVPVTVFSLLALLHLDLKNKKIYMWMRKQSILIFVTQRLFLSALPSVLPGLFEILYSNSYFGLFVVIGITIGFSGILINLSDKIKALKKMM